MSKIKISKQAIENLIKGDGSLSTYQLANLLQISRTSIRRYIKTYNIPYISKNFPLREEISCATCSSITKNPKFCSKNCAAIFNNKIAIKRARTNKCKTCSTLILASVSYCSICFKNLLNTTNVATKTKLEATSVGRLASKYCRIREHARKILENLNLQKQCKSCGYNRYVETCHIKAITSFADDDLVSTINDPSNLVYLCPTCHWEFDNGLLTLQN